MSTVFAEQQREDRADEDRQLVRVVQLPSPADPTSRRERLEQTEALAPPFDVEPDTVAAIAGKPTLTAIRGVQVDDLLPLVVHHLLETLRGLIALMDRDSGDEGPEQEKEPYHPFQPVEGARPVHDGEHEDRREKRAVRAELDPSPAAKVQRGDEVTGQDEEPDPRQLRRVERLLATERHLHENAEDAEPGEDVEQPENAEDRPYLLWPDDEDEDQSEAREERHAVTSSRSRSHGEHTSCSDGCAGGRTAVRCAGP
ncbi:MAG: hypothetical protein J0I07_17630 [Myxococcales bacterium]|nr:hypothetical protein [Myxococcales bacterium]